MFRCSALCLLFLAPATPNSAPSIQKLQLEISEEFRSSGDEPAYWASYSLSDASRSPLGNGLVEFAFQLKEIEAVLGSSEPVSFLPTSGVSRLKILQDQETQIVNLPGDTAVSSFLNGCLLGLEPLGSNFEVEAKLFDGSVVPGATQTSTQLRCTSEVLPLGRSVCTLLEFETAPVEYAIGDVQVRGSFRGVALIDRAEGQVDHLIFEQLCSVTNGDKQSQVSQVTRTVMLNEIGQPNQPLTEGLRKRMDVFLFRAKPGPGDLDPDVLEAEPRPAWAVPVWLAGRMAEASLGLVAEQGTNPIPVTSMGSLVLCDQTLGFASNLLYDFLQVNAGLRAETEIQPQDWEVRSPMERAFQANDPGAVPMDQRLGLLGPETKGSAKIGEEIIPLGITFSAASEAFAQSKSHLDFANGTSQPVTMATGIAGTLSVAAGSAWIGGLAALGTLAGGIAIAESDADEADPASPATLIYTESSVGGCDSGTITLRVVGDSPGQLWTMDAVGTAQQECGGNGTSWNESGAGRTDASGNTEFTIPVLPYADCLSGTLSVRKNGELTRFNYSWPAMGVSGVATGSVSDDCF